MKIAFAVLLVCLAAVCAAKAPAPVAPAGNEYCAVCELIVSSVEKYISENKTEQEIIALLDEVCDALPVFKQECDSVVAMYLPKIIAWIIQGESPEKLCSQIKLCSASVEDTVEGHEYCAICQLVISAVENYIASNKTEQEIDELLDGLCKKLPVFSDQCIAFVNLYVDKAIQWIVSGESPDKFCSQIGFCASAERKPEPEGNEYCAVCQLVISAVENYIASNKTETEIEELLDNLCKKLPVFSEQCISFVNMYVDEAIKWIINGESPDKFCAQIGLCASVEKKVEGNEFCAVCELVISAVENYLASNKTEQEIEELLDDLCKKLPIFSSECVAFVNEYVDLAIKWIVNGESPEKFCSQIGMCASAVVEGNEYCAVCELIISAVENYLASNKTETEIEELLDDLCKKLPVFSNECIAVVNEYVDLAIKWIINGESPEKFCTQVGLCA